MKKNISLTAALMLSAAPVVAQDAIILDDIVVSAGIQDIAINQTGASVDVISAQEMATSGTNMANALEAVSGISMNTSGGFGATSGIRLRGLTQNYVAVRIDGIDYSDPTAPQNAFDFGGMSTAGYDRVEVLKGSQSAIYGSEAIAGVISFKTNSDADLGQKMTLGMELGSYNTRSADFKLSSVTETGSTSLVVTKNSTDGFSAKSDNDEADGYTSMEMRLAADFMPTDRTQFKLSLLSGSSEADYDGASKPDWTTTDDASSKRKRFGAGLTAIYNGDVVSHELALSQTNITRQEVIEGVDASAFNATRNTLRYVANATFGIADLSIGAEQTVEGGDIGGTSVEEEETNYFAEALVAFSDDLNASVALRSSSSSDFGTANVYRASLVYNLGENTTLRALASSGYRAPSLNERYGPWGANPELEPETSTNYELGISHDFQNGTLSATYFDNSIDNLIEYTTGYSQVDKTLKSRGLELSGEFDISSNTTISGNYTYTESENEDVRIMRVPTHDLSLAINSKIGAKSHLGASVRIARDIEGYDAVNWVANVPMEDYTVVNLSAAYDLSDDAQAYVRIENAFDEEYETVKGYNTGGRMIFAGVRASF